MNADIAGQMSGHCKNPTPKVAIQGFEGCFHQIAAQDCLGDGIEIVPCATFREVAACVEDGRADMAVMAIENSIAGSILSNYSILQHSKLKIVGETYLHIRQQLMVNPGVKMEEIKEVHSHPIALLQCLDFLDPYKLKLVETEDTALSARHLSENGSRCTAAIAGELAAELFGLEIIARDIHTIKHNYTRFLILAPRESDIVSHNADKASLYFKTDHKHGSLLRVLQAMSNSDMNMTKLQSYPIPSEPWHYMFHVDAEFSSVEVFFNCIEKMRKESEELHIYGIYQKGIDNK